MCSVSLCLGPTSSETTTVGGAVSVGREAVRTDDLGTANGAFELFARSVLGAAANLGAAFGTTALLVGTAQGHHQLVVDD